MTVIAEEIIEEVQASEILNETSPLLKDGVRVIEEQVVEDEDGNDDQDDGREVSGDLKSAFYRLPYWQRPNPVLLAVNFFLFTFSATLLMAAQVDRTIQLVCDETLDGLFVPPSNRDARCREAAIMGKVANFNLNRGIIKGVLSFAVLPRIVSLSDRIGRRPLFVFCAGLALADHLIQAVCFMSTPLLNYRSLYVSSVLNAFGGEFTGIQLLSFPYLSDCIKDSKRARHFSMLSGISFLALAVAPNLGSQMLKRQKSMDWALVLSLFLDVIGLLVCVLLLAESRMVRDQKVSAEVHQEAYDSARPRWKVVLDYINFLKPLQSLTFPHMTSSRKRRMAIFLVVIRFMTISVIIFGNAPLELLVEMAFQWRASELGYIMTLIGGVGAVVMTIGVPFGIKTFSRIYKVSSTELDNVDIRLIELGVISVTVGLALMGFATSPAVFVLGACVSQMGVAAAPVIQSTIVKYAEKKRIGMVFGAMDQMSQVSSLLAQTVSLAMFQRFIAIEPRITLHLAFAMIGMFTIAVLIVLR